MDADSGMNEQFAKRLRRQQLCSPSRVVLHETHNTTHVPATPRPNNENLRQDVTPRDAIDTGALELLERKAQVQRWLFPPTLDTPPPSEQDKLSESDVEEGNSCDSWLSFPSSSSSCSTPHKQILEERLSTPDIAPPPLFKISVGHTVNVSADRYIPARSPGNWSTRFSMIPDDCSTRSSPKKIRNKKTDLKDKDNDAYSSLLRNELLGSNIGSLKPHPVPPPKRKNLFRYSMSIENEQNIESTAPYTSWSVSSHSQRLLRTSHKAFRQISKIPFKVLDAPELKDDFYLNLVDWSSQNVLSVGLGSCVYLWSALSGKVTRLCNLTCENNKVTSVAWSERGNYLAVGTDGGQVQVWDVCEAKRVSMLGSHSARVSTMAWSGDLLSSGGRDSVILQRDIRTPQHSHDVRRLSGHSQEVCGLKWSPDSQYLASGGNENLLIVWSMHSLTPVQTYTEHQAAVKAIAWSPHHHGLLASGGGTADRCIRFWNTLTGQPMQCVDTGSQVCNLAWSKHSSELVSTHGYPCNPIQLWKYPSMRPVAKLTGHSQRVSYLAVAPDGEAIVTGSGDETLRFWKVFTKDKFLKDNKSPLNLFSNIR